MSTYKTTLKVLFCNLPSKYHIPVKETPNHRYNQLGHLPLRHMRTLKRCQYITAIVAVRQTVSMQVSILYWQYLCIRSQQRNLFRW